MLRHPDETVETTTLDRFAAKRDVGRIHLLKIDTEGHDLEVLKGAAQMLDDARVEIIQVEAEFDAPGRRQPSLEEMQAYLRQRGYYLYGIYNQCRSPVPKAANAAEEPPKVLVFCDALFVCARPRITDSGRDHQLVDPVALGQRSQALLTMLYRSTDRLSRRGAPMEYLAHSASFDSDDKNAPSNPESNI